MGTGDASGTACTAGTAIAGTATARTVGTPGTAATATATAATGTAGTPGHSANKSAVLGWQERHRQCRVRLHRLISEIPRLSSAEPSNRGFCSGSASCSP